MTLADPQGVLDRLQAERRIPSLVAGRLGAGRLVWTGGAGDVAGPVADTQYRIGSITKTMVAVAVLRLRDEGLLDLDAPLGRHLDCGYAEVTLRALLAHTGGLQSEPVGPWWERSPGVDLAALLAANDGARAVAAPGSWFHYSNLGYALLGAVVAHVRGRDWWHVVRDEVLAPLGMDRTTYAPQGPAAQGLSVDHLRSTLVEEPHQDTGAMAPAGQLWSTVTDLGRWAGFLATGHPDVLAAATLAEMAHPQDPATDYGLGLRTVGRWTGHTGSMPGFVASCFVDRATGDGAVALSNATLGLPADAVPDLLHAPDPAPVAEPVTPWRPATEVPAIADEVVGWWFWGTTAIELRWSSGLVESRVVASGRLTDRFAVVEDGLVGVEGYHRGERLDIVRGRDGGVHHLTCATFVYTRTPYDPTAAIPGLPLTP